MPTEVFAALLGAIVGFGGTYLVQRGQWRRNDLEHVRLRLGAVRALTIDLCAADLTARITEENGVLAVSGRFPTEAWFTHGHLVLGALKGPNIEPLMQVFGRFDMLNATAANGPVDLKDQPDAVDSLSSLRTRIDEALNLLAAFEIELDEKRERLQHPWKARLGQLNRLLAGAPESVA